MSRSPSRELSWSHSSVQGRIVNSLSLAMMAGSSATVNPPSLSEWFGNCMQTFREFLLALGDDNCHSILLKQVDISEVLGEYGRAKIWGEQSKADLPARARGSLDDVLRHDDNLRQLVQGIFARLGALLSQGKFHSSQSRDIRLTLPQRHISPRENTIHLPDRTAIQSAVSVSTPMLLQTTTRMAMANTRAVVCPRFAFSSSRSLGKSDHFMIYLLCFGAQVFQTNTSALSAQSWMRRPRLTRISCRLVLDSTPRTRVMYSRECYNGGA